MEIREYIVTYISKEFLQRNGWKIIAFNPPGSQGTFTITNPKKDPGYRGQTGSLSPDIVALKTIKSRNIFLIVEAKPSYKEADVIKMRKMFEDPARLEIFFRLVKGHANANNITYDESLVKKLFFVKAHGGELNDIKDVGTILISQNNPDWNLKNIDPKHDIYKEFKVEFNRLFSED